MKLCKAIALNNTNKTRIKHEEILSQERVELEDNPSICGTSADSPN